MKSLIKSSLLMGISLFLVLLTDHRLRRECEEGCNDDRTPEDERSRPEPASPLPGGEPLSELPEAASRSAAPTVIFSGTVVRTGERFALREIAGAIYTLDSAGRALPWEGSDVRVTGKLDLGTSLLHVDAIESAVL